MCPKNTVIMLCKLVNEYMTVSDRRVALKTKTNCRKNGVFLAAIAVLFEIAMIQKRAGKSLQRLMLLLPLPRF